MGPKTLKAINNANPVQLYNGLKESRITFLKARAHNVPSQKKFLKGWLNRAEGFKRKDKYHKYNVNCD